MRRLNYIAGLILLMVFLASCTGVKYNVLNALPEQEKSIDQTFTPPVIKVGSELCVNISALNAESAQYFRTSRWKEGATGIECLYYQVKENGNIEIPILGETPVEGMSLLEAAVSIKEALDHLLKEPRVRIEYIDYQVSILGEVAIPGLYDFPSGRVTLFEAIAKAGGIGQFGKRGTVLIIRDTPQGIKHIRLDIRKDEFLISDYYYLHNDDVVMIDSNPARVANSHNISTLGSVLVGFGAIAAILATK
jgi:polysaccharide export outer membrane protein